MKIFTEPLEEGTDCFMVGCTGPVDWVIMISAPDANEACTRVVEMVIRCPERFEGIALGINMVATNVTLLQHLLLNSETPLFPETSVRVPTHFCLANAGYHNLARVFQKTENEGKKCS